MPKREEIEVVQKFLFDWSRGNLREFPWREEESSFRILVAEILLQATLAQKVAPIYTELFDCYPTPRDLAQADVDDLATLLEPLGLHNRKAEAIVELANQYPAGDVPKDEDDLLELPMVGKYAANATLCFGFDQHRPIMDTNVAKVFAKEFDVELNPNTKEAWEFAKQILPEEDYQRFNLALLDYGATL